jgi:hypothetical protein
MCASHTIDIDDSDRWNRDLQPNSTYTIDIDDSDRWNRAVQSNSPSDSPLSDSAVPAPVFDYLQLIHNLLLLIGAVQVILLVVSGISSILNPPQPLQPGNSPAGTVERFYSAVIQRDYRLAYGLLSDSSQVQLPYDEFERKLSGLDELIAKNGNWGSDIRFSLDEMTAKESMRSSDHAIVDVTIPWRQNIGPNEGSNWQKHETQIPFDLDWAHGAWEISQTGSFFELPRHR